MPASDRRGAGRRLTAGAAIVAVIGLAAAVAFFWTPYPATIMDLDARLLAPSADHLFGTDRYGRDILSMVLRGAHNSLAVAALAIALGAGIGIPLGLVAAARTGGMLDTALAGLYDLALAFPALLIAVAIATAGGPDAINAVIAIGAASVPAFACLTRDAAGAVWRHDFILAARLSGHGGGAITLVHILPNIAGALVAGGVAQGALAVLAEAGLSFAGLGAPAPTPSWGRMLAEALPAIDAAPHLVVFPGLAIMITALGLGLIADGLRARNRAAAGRG